jgi:dynein heavy chain
MFSLIKPGDFTNIMDIQFIAAMIHPGGGRNDIPERLKSQFVIFNCTLPADNSIDHIFKTVASGYFSVERGFTEEIHDMIGQLVPLTRNLWQLTKGKMLPTPAKFHYVFNLRDLSRIWQTILNVDPTECEQVETLLALWKHECTRVIADRFTCLEDKDWFDKTLNAQVVEKLGEEIFLHPEPFFVDFLREAPEVTGDEPEDADLDAPKIYEQIESLESLHVRLQEYMQMYNENVRGASMDLVFFKDAMTHLIKISRIIRTPQGTINN